MIFLFSLEEGKKAVKLAREAIEKYLADGTRPDPPEDLDEKFEEKRGVFVTLNKNGDLRGCIGRPLPNQKLTDGLIDSAISAATSDPRFPKLKPEELENVTVEISILTQPKEVEVNNSKQCSEKIEIGKDGLIVKCRGREGLLLPQVPVDRDWDEEEFLSQTCVKAGLSPDTWVESDVDIQKFSAQVFKEKSPKGEIFQEELSS